MASCHSISELDMYDIAPVRHFDLEQSPWEGNCKKKPWNYKVTAIIPVIDTYDYLALCVELLRLQTLRPFIVVIDTGSTQENLDKIMSLRAPDIEVHSLRFNGVLHPSDFPAIAMDLGQAMCRTKFMFATHSDVFLRRRNFLEDLIVDCKNYPVVGYEMSPRLHDDWRGMVSHTATMYRTSVLDEIGFGWNLRRLANMYGLPNHKPDESRPNWPDTEVLGNVILRDRKVPVKIIGKENNFERTKDKNIDHCRSITSGLLYSPEYYEAALKWVEKAQREAKNRIRKWQKATNGKKPSI